MRHISAIPDERLPRDDEFRFRERSKRLVEKWHELLNATAGHIEEEGNEEIIQATKKLDLNANC
jgi:hypothetical protein